MDTIKILCVEDEEMYLDRFEMLIEQSGYEFAGGATNALDAIELFYESQPDIILMDINLDDNLDGIDLAKRFLKKRQLPIIFVTALKDEATFERIKPLQPFSYILKPFNAIQLQRTIELAVLKLATSEKDGIAQDVASGILSGEQFFVKINNRLKKIALSDILYLKAEGRYTEVITKTNKKYPLRIALTTLHKKLNPRHFIQTHRSYIAAINEITEIDLSDYTVILGTHSIPLSRNNKDMVIQRLNWLG